MTVEPAYGRERVNGTLPRIEEVDFKCQILIRRLKKYLALHFYDLPKFLDDILPRRTDLLKKARPPEAPFENSQFSKTTKSRLKAKM